MTDESTDQVSDGVTAGLDDTQQQMLEVPVEVIIANHLIGIWEIARLHLVRTEPDLDSAKLAIDTVGLVVDGLGDRLGEHRAVMEQALHDIRMAFVQVKTGGGAD